MDIYMCVKNGDDRGVVGKFEKSGWKKKIGREKKKKDLDDFFSTRSCPWLPDAYYPARNPGEFDAELRNSWSRDVNHQMARSFSRN